MAPEAPAPSLAERIEHERTELMQIHAMVRCLNDVLLYADDDDSPMHADVAYVIGRLLNEAVGRLDVVRMRVAQLESAGEGPESLAPHQVREQRATYGCFDLSASVASASMQLAEMLRRAKPATRKNDHCSDVPYLS